VKISGSCLCGQIKFQVCGVVHMINNCHCSMCRKIHGAAYGSFMHVDADGFQWLCGAELISTYQPPQQDERAFCSNCGSNMPVIEREDNNVVIPAGSLDTDPGLKPSMHIFTDSKAPWHEITDSLPQFKEFPPQEWIEKELEKIRQKST